MTKGGRKITRIRKAKVDKLSTTPAGAASTLEIQGTAILPRQTYEPERGYITIDGWDIYILRSSRAVVGGEPRPYADGDILHTDQIEIDGEVWAVDGRPAPYDKGAMRKATLVKVKRVGT